MNLLDRDDCSVAALLPHHSHDPNGKVFIQTDGSLGLAWALGLLDCEIADDDTLEAFASRLVAMLRLLPRERAAFQFILEADPDARDRIDPWLAATREGGALLDLAASRAAAANSMAIDDAGLRFQTRSLRLTFTMRIFPAYGPLADAGETYLAEKKKLLDRASAIENLWAQLGLPFRRLGDADLVSLLYRALNPARARTIRPPRAPAAGESALLRDVVSYSTLEADQSTGHIKIDGVAHRVLSVTGLPAETWPGQMTRPDPKGPGVLDLLPEGWLVYNFHVVPGDAARAKFESRFKFAWAQSRGDSPDGKLEAATSGEQAAGVLKKLADGALIVASRLHVVVRGASPEGAREKAGAAVNALSHAGLQAVDEDALALTLFLQCLPLAYSPENDVALKRARQMEDANFADLLPLFGAFQGGKTPDLLLANRRGEPITFSFFDSDVAPHGIIAGVSGAGKSVLTSNLVLSVLRRGGRVFVLDRGNSYQRLARMLGGTYVAFDPEHPTPINPCAGELTPDRRMVLVDVLLEMATQGFSTPTPFERSLVARALAQAEISAKAAKRELRVSDVKAALGAIADSVEAHRLAECLGIYTDDGPFAAFFDRPNQVGFDAAFTVFELGETALRKEVASVLLMSLLHNITEFCTRRKDVPKLIVIDEAWTLLKSANTSGFLENVLRTYRKLYTAAVLVTQQVTDFEGSTGAAIRANAPNRLFLMQTPDTIVAMQKLLDLSPELKEALVSVRSRKDLYSEMLVDTGRSRGFARLVQDPLTYWVTTTDPAANAKFEKLLEDARSKGAADPLREALRAASRGKAGGQP